MARRSEPSEPDPGQASPPPPEGSPAPVPELVLDAVAAILRALGEVARPSTGGPQSLESWARHILVLAPPPGTEPQEAPGDRDWAGLRRYTVGHIREEGSSTTQSITDLQDALWAMIDGFAQALADDSAADHRAAQELERLRVATNGPTEALKATVLATVQRLGEIIGEKRGRQQELARELGNRIDVLRLELEDAKREAEVDALTQLWNRSVFEREIRRALQIRSLLSEPVCLVIVDVDCFKAVNDTHGHQIGDMLLEKVSRALTLGFPRRTDIVARYGGDEFVVILRDATAVDGERLAQRFAESLQDIRLDAPGDPISITASVGVAEALTGELAESWIERADRALYAAKQAGRNRVVIADAGNDAADQVAA